MNFKTTIALVAMLTLPVTAFAQDEDEKKKDVATVVKVDKWTIKSEVNTLTNSMKQFNGLIDSLGKANKDLGETFKKFLNDPKNELLAAQLQKKLAKYVSTASKEFDTIIATQDVLTSNFRNLRHKLGQLGGHLKDKSVDFKGQSKSHVAATRTIDNEMIRLAKKSSDPNLTESQRNEIRRKFNFKLREKKLQERYIRGYSARQKSYQRLQKTTERLENHFGKIHSDFENFIKNLESEKKYLRAVIEQQVDTLRLQKLMREGIVGSENALVSVNKKIATLYLKVDTFGSIQDRISDQMSNFMDSQTSALNVTDKIGAVGTTGVNAGALNKDVDKLMAEYAKKTVTEPEEETEEKGDK